MRTLLVLRGTVGLVVAGLFIASGAGSVSRLLVQLADYLIVDGVLGLAVASSLYLEGLHDKPHLGSLGAVLLIDAAGRAATGLAVHVWPGIPGFPVTAALYVGMIAAFTALLGVAEAGLIAEEGLARFGPRHARAQFAIPPVLMSAVVSVAFAVALLFTESPPSLRLLMAGYIASAGCVMFIMAWNRRRGTPQARTT